ncbi:acylglycerol lipase [Malassezia psittaci]|uniref:Acylglycerol lipase n=1 Tax=Malassezia psittaci TaxID=1821823 RepID=A0AAF0JDF8_9BASI|nr:acylglycerol lipase [Malassezia psittaci]
MTFLDEVWQVGQLVYFVFIEPVLVYLGLTTWGNGDPTYGRAALPYSAIEREAIYENNAVRKTQRRVYLANGKPQLDISLGTTIRTLPHSYQHGKIDAWVNYYVWEMPEVTRKVNADVYLVHGINDYSGKVAPQALGLMMSGFRIIAIDLPSFGRSSGLQAYVPSLSLLSNALDAVIYHVHMWDQSDALPDLASRKRFAQGSSLGGFMVLYHAALHPPIASTKQGGPESHSRLALDGVAVTAPMLRIAPETHPGLIMEVIGRFFSKIAGRLPLLRAIKGNISDDPKYVFRLTAE